jgi:hypothetical protein
MFQMSGQVNTIVLPPRRFHPHSEPVSVSNIAVSLSDQEDLASGLVLRTKSPSNTACIKDYLGMLSCADNPTPAGRAAAFLSFGSSKVQVEFETICKRLRRRVLESVTRERHGAEGVRILRLLLDTGKMDEKQVRAWTYYRRVRAGLWHPDFQGGHDTGQGHSTLVSINVCRVLDQHARSTQKCRSQPSADVLPLVHSHGSALPF